ncbi:MAG: quinone-dependent dihydroorotate dehydrogenase, partial [Haliea sp.]
MSVAAITSTCASSRSGAIFTKIAPDLDEAQVDVIAATLKRHAMDGV